MHKCLRIVLAIITVVLFILWCVVASTVPVSKPAMEWTAMNALMLMLTYGPLAFAAAIIASLWLMRAWLFHAVAALMAPAFLLSLEQIFENPIMGVPLAGYSGLWCLLYYRAVWQKQKPPARPPEV